MIPIDQRVDRCYVGEGRNRFKLTFVYMKFRKKNNPRKIEDLLFQKFCSESRQFTAMWAKNAIDLN